MGKPSWQILFMQQTHLAHLLCITVDATLCLVADVARFQQLAEESCKLKQAKKHARKERRQKQQAKPFDEAAARLAEHKAKVAKQERELHRAKANQQKAELAANKRKMLLQRDRLLSQQPSSCDPDEGEMNKLHSQVTFCKEQNMHYCLHLTLAAWYSESTCLLSGNKPCLF